MKKKLTAILAVMLAALMLCGGALPASTESETRFDDMPYVRPNITPIRALADQVTRTLDGQAGYRRPLAASLGRDWADALRLLNLYDILDTLVWQCAYAEFEQRAFDMPEPSVEKLNALMGEICREYGFSEKQADEMELGWTETLHFFESPFYVISYPVSACCALEIYERELRDGTGLDCFLRMADSREIGLVGAAAETGLQNPVTVSRVRDVAAFLEEQLLGTETSSQT